MIASHTSHESQHAYACTDHSSNAMQQPQALAIVRPQMNVQPQPSNFSNDMSNLQLVLWLMNHPSLAGTDYEEDIRKLSGTTYTIIPIH